MTEENDSVGTETVERYYDGKYQKKNMQSSKFICKKSKL